MSGEENKPGAKGVKGNGALRIGDQVRLLSGGPIMTVSFLCNESTVRCAWFTSGDLNQAAEFPMQALARVEARGPQF